MLRVRDLRTLSGASHIDFVFAETVVCWFFPMAEKFCAVGYGLEWAGMGFVPHTWGSHLICTDPSQPGLLGFLSGWKSSFVENRIAPGKKKFSVFFSSFCVLLFKHEEDRGLFESQQDHVS